VAAEPVEPGDIAGLGRYTADRSGELVESPSGVHRGDRAERITSLCCHSAS
jgi:hypothetical protein